MRKGTFTGAVLAAVFFTTVAGPAAAGQTAMYRVSAFAPIEKGDVAGAQADAITGALEAAITEAFKGIVPDRTFTSLGVLFENRVLPSAETFVTNYKIDRQDVSDRAYTVHLSVSVDLDLLRRSLSELGIIKEPGSPPLGAVFVTVDAALGINQVSALGLLAETEAARGLSQAGIVFIPPPAGDFPFRVIRPPQTPEALVSEGMLAMADLAVGVLFKQAGEGERSQTTLSVPMSMAIQIVDVSSGGLLEVDLQELVVSLSDPDGKILGKEPGQVLTEMSQRTASRLKERIASEQAEKTFQVLEVLGNPTASQLQALLGGLRFKLGEEAVILPRRFEPDRYELQLWTIRNADEIGGILESLSAQGSGFAVRRNEAGFTLSPAQGRKAAGVRGFGEEIRFYRRLPAPGVDNPEDVRKTETVPWQEAEPNDTLLLANLAPLSIGVLGRIDPSRDRDFYRFEVPVGAAQITVDLEQSGPTEVKPRVRAFDGQGRFLGDSIASARGRNLRFSLNLPEPTSSVIITVEDDLGRYSSSFAYVLTAASSGSRTSDESP